MTTPPTPEEARALLEHDDDVRRLLGVSAIDLTPDDLEQLWAIALREAMTKDIDDPDYDEDEHTIEVSEVDFASGGKYAHLDDDEHDG